MSWPTARLGDIAEINPRLPAALRNEPERRVSFVSMSQVSEDGRLRSTDDRCLGDVIKGYTYFERGDVLLAKITPCMENGKAVLVGDTMPHPVGFGSTEFHVVRPTPRLWGRYLFHTVWNPCFRHAAELNMTGSAGQKRVPTRFLRDLSVPLPPLPEQKRIAAILDKADAIRRKRAQAIKLADDFLKSAFLHMFGDPVTNPKGWEKPHLERVCEKVVDCPHSTPRWSESGVVCLRTSNLGKGEWIWADTRYVTEEDYRERTKRSEILPDDVILSREGTVGVLALVASDMRLCMGQRLVQLRVVDNKLSPRFLLHLLLHDLAPGRLGRLMAGSTSKHLNLRELRKLPVALPPLDLQRRFAAFAESIEQQKQRMRTQTRESDSLFASLQQRAFRGEL